MPSPFYLDNINDGPSFINFLNQFTAMLYIYLKLGTTDFSPPDFSVRVANLNFFFLFLLDIPQTIFN